jgi:ribosome maturation factor RimP
MQSERLLDRIREIVSNVFQDNKIELVSLTYKREGSTKVLKVLADTERGITADECAKMNEVIGEALAGENLIEENYILEISSPGLDRPLKTKQDFLRIKGKRICVYTFAPVEDKKEFTGTLETADESNIVISSDDVTLTKIPLDKISKATLDCKNLI